MPVILSCSLSLYRADVFFAMPTKPVAKKPIPGKPQAVKPAQKNVVQKKPAPDKTKGLPLLKETPQASLVQKKPAPKPAPDKVENLAKEYLAELKEVDVTFEKGTAVLEKYRAKYPELASYIEPIRDRRATQPPAHFHRNPLGRGKLAVFPRCSLDPYDKDMGASPPVRLGPP